MVYELAARVPHWLSRALLSLNSKFVVPKICTEPATVSRNTLLPEIRSHQAAFAVWSRTSTHSFQRVSIEA